MFTGYHIAWLAICAVVIAGALTVLHRRRPPLEAVLSAGCVLGVVSEVVKTFSVITLVPSASGEGSYPYIEIQHLPLHLCSMQIALIFYTRFSGNRRLRQTLLAFMYPSCLAGSLAALLVPTIFSTSIRADQAFTHPLAYQFFLYHTMLLVLGVYIPLTALWQWYVYLALLALAAVLVVTVLYLPYLRRGEDYGQR